MFEKFSERARLVMTHLARQEAARLGSEFVGTEHVLLGLVLEEKGIAPEVVCRLGVDLRRLRAEVEKVIHENRGPARSSESIPFTPRVKRTMELADEEAFQARAAVVSTGHLLLGLFKEGEGIAHQVLRNLGVSDLDRMRAEVDFIERRRPEYDRHTSRQGELCLRNISAAIRDTRNALNAARIDRTETRTDHGDAREIDDATIEFLKRGLEGLEAAEARLARWGMPKPK